MSHDPLDELIDDLERLVPRAASLSHDWQFAFIQRMVETFVYGTNDEIEAFERDPDYETWIRYWKELRNQSEPQGLQSGRGSSDDARRREPYPTGSEPDAR